MITIVAQTYYSQITNSKNHENIVPRANRYKYQDQVLKKSGLLGGNDRIRVTLLDGCKLGISHLRFDYNAKGGRGIGRKIIKKGLDEDDSLDAAIKTSGIMTYDVDMTSIFIPAVSALTTRVNGFAPFPPFSKVEIVPEFLQGRIHQPSRKVELRIIANLSLSISGYNPPPLRLDTILTSEETKGVLFGTVRGQRLGKDGKCKVVGIAMVDSIVDSYVNSLIGLPCECLVSLNTIISFF